LRIHAALAAVVAAVVASPGVAALGPPVIREPWTPLPCPAHPKPTIEIEGCLERAIMRSDRRIDAKAATILHLLRRQFDRAAFVRGERAWLLYRRRSCSAEASIYRGGGAEPVAFLTCEKGRNRRHLADLETMERTLKQR
jgi:uncharacterized protein YecT (DUF1311 family)